MDNGWFELICAVWRPSKARISLSNSQHYVELDLLNENNTNDNNNDSAYAVHYSSLAILNPSTPGLH